MQSPYMPSQPAWLTNLLNGMERRPLGLTDPRELESNQGDNASRLFGPSRPESAYTAPPSGSDALVMRILDEAATRRPPMGLFDPSEFGQADVSSPSIAGASSGMFDAFGGNAPSARNSADALVQRILDEAASRRPPIGLFGPIDSDLPQRPTPPAFLPSGPASNPQPGGADALVQRLLDDAANKRPPIGLFDPREFGLLQAPTASDFRSVFPPVLASQPVPATARDSSDALVQRILDNAASQSTPIGLFDGRVLGPVVGTSNSDSNGLGRDNSYEIDGKQYTYNFLNHGVSADLRFRDILYGFGGPLPDHGFIVVRDPETGTERAFQAYPTLNPLPAGTLDPTSEVYGPGSEGYNTEPVTASTYITGLPAAALEQKLEDYGTAVDREDFTYVPLGPNSNTYVTGAWREITGSIPRLPPNVNAPGYGRTLYLRR